MELILVTEDWLFDHYLFNLRHSLTVDLSDSDSPDDLHMYPRLGFLPVGEP